MKQSKLFIMRFVEVVNEVLILEVLIVIIDVHEKDAKDEHGLLLVLVLGEVRQGTPYNSCFFSLVVFLPPLPLLIMFMTVPVPTIFMTDIALKSFIIPINHFILTFICIDA
jgi:hypothetical protein